ncbi:MAG TPA: hypothetical protein VFH94_16830 [Streptomyces sp.]|nr:hypothetical protein [Streptomyces sp.]
MDWGTLIGTGLGAVVGVGSTLIADRVRWKRDQGARQEDVKRQLYGEYLTALTRTRNELKELRGAAVAPDERARLAGQFYRQGGAYELRYQLAITAPTAVVECSEDALRKLRVVREKIEEDVTGAPLDEEFTALIHSVKSLRDATRSDLGADA